jgi:putative heme-binding domain-containing protein
MVPMKLTAIAARSQPFVVTAILVGSLWPGSAAIVAQTRSTGSASADAVAGKRIFDAQCAWCHGTDGDGGNGPNLHGTLRHATDLKSIIDIVTNGIPATDMPSFRSPLTERSIRQAAAYVQSLSRVSGRPGPGNAARGAVIFESNGCRSCHAVSGQGGTLGPELTSIGGRRGPAYLRAALVEPAAAHPPGYLVVEATPSSGAEVRGIRVNEDVFWIQIRDASGSVHSLEKSTLTKLERQTDATLMPSYARLAAPALDDLVTYLASLRGER